MRALVLHKQMENPASEKGKDFDFLRNSTREITPHRSTDNSSHMPSCGLYRNTNQ